MRRALYLLWGAALIVAALFVWRGISRALGDPMRLGWRPGRFLEFDEEVRVSEQSKNGPFGGDWDYVRRGKVRLCCIDVEADGTIELVEAWRRGLPEVSKYASNGQDMLARFGKTFAVQLHQDPCGAKYERQRTTGDPIGEAAPQELDAAVETVFRRARLLPGGRIAVGDGGDWTERIGPLTAKFEWKVTKREERAGRPCLVYEVRPTAVLAVKAEQMPNFAGTIVWHTGTDEGYVTTKGSVVRSWIAEQERVPVHIESDTRLEVVPQKYVGQYRRTQLAWSLAHEEQIEGAAREDASAFAEAARQASAGKTVEAMSALGRVRSQTWAAWSAGRVEALSALLPLVGRPCPPLPRGDWIADTPKSIEALRGKVVIVDFWLVRATPCTESMKALKALRHRHEGQELYVVGVTCEEPQNGSDVIQRYLGDQLIDYPILVSDEGISDPRFQVQGHGLPYCLLLDREGRVRWTGAPSDPALEPQLQALLAERK